MASTDSSPDAADRSEADASDTSEASDPSEAGGPADSDRTPTAEAGTDDGGHQSDGGRETVSLDGLALPTDATDEEAAAIAAAIAAHLQHRQRAAAAAAAAVANRQSVDYADRWTLAGRLDPQGKRVIPRDVERGDEWRAAARSFPR